MSQFWWSSSASADHSVYCGITAYYSQEHCSIVQAAFCCAGYFQKLGQAGNAWWLLTVLLRVHSTGKSHLSKSLCQLLSVTLKTQPSEAELLPLPRNGIFLLPNTLRSTNSLLMIRAITSHLGCTVLNHGTASWAADLSASPTMC